MKSIVQEASSIVKAIEKGWNRVEMPQEFTVKILEYPEYNFLGMTKKSAKIALFFEARATARKDDKKPLKTVKRERFETVDSNKRERNQEPREAQSLGHDEAKKGPLWTEQMIGDVKQWVMTILQSMGKSRIPFTVATDRYYLKLTFDGQLCSTTEKEKALFRSFAFLIMQTIRQKHKRHFKGYKVVLNTVGDE